MDYRMLISPADLAAQAAGCVVTLADPDARANAFHWHRARPWLARVVDALGDCGDAEIRDASRGLLREPTDARAYERLKTAVADAPSPVREDLLPVVAAARAHSRVGLHHGARYADRIAGGRQDYRPATPSRPAASQGSRSVRVVVPFRDRDPEHPRLQNLLACLAALNDQTTDRGEYAVTVVESDSEPRWQQIVEPLADDYLFAYNEGPFNKSWAVNVGVVESAAQTATVCVLDGDALVDRDFVRRNVERFTEAALGAFMPFRDLLYLDPESSSWAVAARCVRRAAAVDTELVRGFLGYRSPGVCVWMRRDIFEHVGGFDERYEGWGGEDFDLILRLQAATAFHVYDDPMLHLHHPFSADLVDDHGDSVNRHLQPLTWRPETRIGLRTRYAPADADRMTATGAG